MPRSERPGQCIDMQLSPDPLRPGDVETATEGQLSATFYISEAEQRALVLDGQSCGILDGRARLGAPRGGEAMGLTVARMPRSRGAHRRRDTPQPA